MSLFRRYGVISITGYLFVPDYSAGRPRGSYVGSREWDLGPLTTYYIWDKAQCEIVSEHGSRAEAKRESRKLNVEDEQWDEEQHALPPFDERVAQL